MQRFWGRLSLAGALMLPGIAEAEGDRPIDLDARYIADVLHVAHGGLRGGTRYIDELQLTASIDSSALGWSGGELFVYGMANTAGNFGDLHLGEFQKVSNIDTRPAVHLYEAWYEHQLASDRLSLRAGLYDFNSEFDSNPPAKLFLQSSHGIGVEIAQTGQNGPSIFPVTSLAARLAWHAEGYYVQAAVLDGVPGDPADVRRTTIKLGGGDGALLAVEGGYQWDRGGFALGAWGYTAKFDDLLRMDAAGNPIKRSDNRGVYGYVNATVTGETSGRHLDAFLRAGAAQAAINPVSTFLGAGLVLERPFASRSNDSAGIAIAIAKTGDPFRRVGLLAGSPVSGAETTIEATYRAQITPWFVVQPDVHVVIHPGFDPARRHAVVVGARFEISPFALLH